MDLLRRDSASAAASVVADDGVFGPGYGQEFDFTMVFSNTILTIIPAFLMIAAFPVYVLTYSGKPPVTSKRLPLLIKLISGAALVALEIARSCVWSYPQNATPLLLKTTLAAKIASTLSSAMLAGALYYDHCHAPQPTAFLSLFLFLSTITEGSRTRSFFLRGSSEKGPEMTTVAGLTLGCVLLKAMLLVLVELPKDLTGYTDEKLVPDATVGFWSRVLLFWANPFMLRGFRSRIMMADLASLGPCTRAQILADGMERIWSAANKEDKHVLVRACCKALLWPIFTTWMSFVVNAAVAFGNVFVIWTTLNQLETSQSREDVMRGVIGANVLMYFVSAASESLSAERINNLSVLLRGSLTGVLTNKATRLPSAAAKESALLSLMTADINGVVGSLESIFEISLCIPKMVVGFYLLWTVVGYASSFVIIAIVLSVVVGWFVGKRMNPAMSQWNKAIQHRVSETAALLVHAKAVKMMGLEPVVTHFLNGLREQEISASIAYRKIRIMTVMSYPINYWFTPFIALVGAVKLTVWKGGLDPVGVWVALSFMNTIRTPMWFLLMSWGIVGGVNACVGRIQEFLLQEERVDIRQLRDFSVDMEKKVADEKKKTGVETTKRDTEGSEKDSSASTDDKADRPCILLEHVSVSAREAEKFVLKDVNFSIPAGKLTLIVGPVGSGKSVLTRTIIGETTPTGNIYVSSFKMGYCEQSTWLPDSSIQDAITMHTELDETRYDAVIEACALESDIRELGGSQTRIGSNGSKLSGGQRQRVALARALYSACPIIVADDVLSALDKRTAMHVFKAVFGVDGILKRQGRTAIMVAHERTWLSSADQVVAVSANPNGSAATVYRGREAIDAFSASEGAAAISTKYLAPREENKEKASAPDRTLEYALQDEKRPAYKLDFSLYRYLYNSVPRKLIFISIFFIMIYGFGERCPELYVRLWSGYSPAQTNYVWGMLGLMFVSMGLAIVNGSFFQLKVIPKISRQTHATFTHSVFGATLSFLTSTGNGNLLNRFGQDLTILGQELPIALNTTLYISSLFLATFAYVLAGTNYTILLIPPILIIIWFLQKFYLCTSQQMRILELEAKAPLFAELREMGAGIEHMRASGVQQHMVERSYQRLDDSQRPYYYLLTIQRWLLLVLDMLTMIVATTLVSIALYETKTTSQASLGLSLYNIASFSGLSKGLIQAWTSLETSLGAALRLRDFEMNTPAERDSPEMQDPPEAWPTKGCVEFKNVSATYGPEPNLPLALQGITATVEGGTKVVIAGRTGSGKSTMVLSILNLVDITGKILIDNIDIATVPRATLRSRITSLPQDSLDFSGSVWENLLPFGAERPDGDAIDEPTVQALLDEVGLWDHVKVKGGLEKPISEMLFSAGQKQLFNVIRAILHHMQFETKIVLMDEVTSSIDHVANERIQKMMETAFRGSTWIIISHDTRAVDNCDLVLHMSGGSLVNGGQVEAESVDTKEAGEKEHLSDE